MVNPRLNGRQGQIVVKPTSGPMARSVRDCIDMMGILAARSNEIDMQMPCLSPFSIEKCISSKNGMRIAYMKSDGFFQPCLAVQRSIDIAKKALEEKGHELIPFEPPVSAQRAFEVYCGLLAADGNWWSFIRGLEGRRCLDKTLGNKSCDDTL